MTGTLNLVKSMGPDKNKGKTSIYKSQGLQLNDKGSKTSTSSIKKHIVKSEENIEKDSTFDPEKTIS